MSNNAFRNNKKNARSKMKDVIKHGMGVTCVDCGRLFTIRAKNKKAAEGCTFNCAHCNKLHIMREKRVHDYHEYFEHPKDTIIYSIEL